MIINRGKIVADGTSENLRKQAHGKEIVRVRVDVEGQSADADEIFKQLKAIDTVEMVDILNREEKTFEVQSIENASSIKQIFKLCVKTGWTLLELSPIETKLEDVFRELTIK